MPNDVKASLSVLFLIVAAVLAYWHGSPVRPDLSTYIMVTAVFFVCSHVGFSRSRGQKRRREKRRLPRAQRLSFQPLLGRGALQNR